MPKDFYDLLGLQLGASQDDIKQAYRDKVKQYHPDKNDSPDAAAQFRTLKSARDTLLSETQRERYDQLGHDRFVRSYGAETDGFEFTGRDYRPAESEDSVNVAERIEDIPFKPEIHPVVAQSVSAVLITAIVYLFGAIQFASHSVESGSIGSNVMSPFGAIGVSSISIQTFINNPLLLTFLLGAIALPAIIAFTVHRLGGRKTQWAYVAGVTSPAISLFLMLLLDIAFPSILGTVLFVLAPVLTVFTFTTDLLSYVLQKYIHFYFEFYKIKFEVWRS